MDVIFTALALVFSAAAVGLGSAALALELLARRAPGEGAPPADGERAGEADGAAAAGDGAPADAAAEREQRRLQEGIANILGYGMEELLGRRGERG